MYLTRVRVREYWSIYDTGWFEIEETKTILVGPNESGKTAILKAIEAINPPGGKSNFDWLRDYPRSRVNEIQRGKVKPQEVTVSEAVFKLTDDEREYIAQHHPDLKEVREIIVGRRLDNSRWLRLEDGPKPPTPNEIYKEMLQVLKLLQGTESENIFNSLQTVVSGLEGQANLENSIANKIIELLSSVSPNTSKERVERLVEKLKIGSAREAAEKALELRLPVFIYFHQYYQVKPSIHLRHLAERIESDLLDDESYDFGNKCLLQLLGFTAKELADLGDAQEPPKDQPEALKRYKDQLDKRHYALNAAKVFLTEQINDVWVGDDKEEESMRLGIHADRQYLKVVVEDELGVEVELDQRSTGFQWLVSFFIVFRAQAQDEYKNAIILLDEPGLSLHGLKQRQFRKTVSKLSEQNQMIYTTHSPFMVGPEELAIVRVVEMENRRIGSKVHTHVTARDPRSFFPLQETLGYDMAQSLFSHQRNLVLEGLTDYWYLDGTAALLRDDNIIKLNPKISLVPAGNASKVVYYASILHAQKLNVATLFDSDQAGEIASAQDELVLFLGRKKIIRTKDVYHGPVSKPEIEDLLRQTLIKIAKEDLGWDISRVAASQQSRPIIDIFNNEIPGFSKYRLAKAYLRWTAMHNSSDLYDEERVSWTQLLQTINKVLQ